MKHAYGVNSHISIGEDLETGGGMGDWWSSDALAAGRLPYRRDLQAVDTHRSFVRQRPGKALAVPHWAPIKLSTTPSPQLYSDLKKCPHIERSRKCDCFAGHLRSEQWRSVSAALLSPSVRFSQRLILMDLLMTRCEWHGRM